LVIQHAALTNRRIEDRASQHLVGHHVFSLP
jgi:hypothetical protein